MGRVSVRTKLQLLIVGLVLVICVGTEYIFFLHGQKALIEEVRRHLAATAQTAAIQINAHAHDRIRTRSDEGSKDYREIKALLLQVKAGNKELGYVYTMRPCNKGMVWEFVVDAESDPKNISHVGDMFDVSNYPELREGLSSPSANNEVKRDRWGTWFSGFAPIKDESGKTVAIVGVDMSAKQLLLRTKYMRQTAIFCLLLSALFALLLGTIVASIVLSPISAFILRLRAAVRGDLETLADDHRKDEIGEVARTFNEMLASLRHKDRMLSEMNTDYLTGLHNHRYFQQSLQTEVERARTYGEEISMLMLDIDRFKLINDSLGHMAGDEILRQLAKILGDCRAQNQIVARYGGEEFAIILPGTGSNGAVAVAEKIRKAVTEHSFEIPKNLQTDEIPPISVSVSIGVAVFPEHSREQDGLIMAADIALYRAKHLGRDRTCIYSVTVKDDFSDPYHVYTFIQDPSKSAIEALAAAVDARDHYTRNHSENVSRYTHQIGESLGLKQTEMELLRMASLLHDVGKIGVPDYVLNKPSGLTGEEMEVIRTHPAVGGAIVRNSHNLDAILPGILYHHERFDGSGYPYGLCGEEIPLLARIIAVADAFDALTTDRPYRRALSTQAAISVLLANSGKQFDPDVVQSFIAEIDERAEAA